MIRKKLNTENESAPEGGRSDLNLGRKGLQAAGEGAREAAGDGGVSENGSAAGGGMGSGDKVEGARGEEVGKGSIGDTRELASEILLLFGMENIDSVRTGLAQLNIVPGSMAGNEVTDPAGWMEAIFNSYFTKEQIDRICTYYNRERGKVLRREEQAQAMIDGMSNDLATARARVTALEEVAKTQEEAVAEAARKLKGAIPAHTVTQELCNGLPPAFGSIRELLLDDPGDEALVKFRFTARLTYTLQGLAVLLANQPADPEENIARLSDGLVRLLAGISGLHIINRREILDLIAIKCSDSTDNLLFISPERSLVVDPSIHNAKALSGGTVKEGISYAILRKDSRQTIKLADITVI